MPGKSKAKKGSVRTKAKAKTAPKAPTVEKTDDAKQKDELAPPTNEYYIRCTGGDKLITLEPEVSKMVTEHNTTRKVVIKEARTMELSKTLKDYPDEMLTRKDSRTLYLGYRLPQAYNMTDKDLETMKKELKKRNLWYEILTVKRTDEFIPEEK